MLTLALAVCGMAMSLFGPQPAVSPRMRAVSPPAPLPTKRMFDLGVVDYDGDSRLDLFTANHKYRSALLRNVGDGHFRDRLRAAGLSPAASFPGLAYYRRPKLGAGGLYLWVRKRQGELGGTIHLRARGGRASGKLGLFTNRVSVEGTDRARVRIRGDERPTVRFRIRAGGNARIRANHLGDLPIDVEVTEPADPAAVRVGSLAVPATARSFRLGIPDRHGYAFADVIGDAAKDVLITGGGLGSAIAHASYRGMVSDELMRGADGGRYQNVIAGSGITKRICRGRRSSWVDFDRDGLLDLSQSCEGEAMQIFRRRGDGFVRVAGPPVSPDTFRWAQLAVDAPPTLLASTPHGMELWAWQDGRFVQTQSLRAGRAAAHLALADFDRDRRLDVLAVSDNRVGNVLLRNVGGRLQRAPRHGLPVRSVAASFVDYDNDGLTDVHLVPQGLYRWDGERFQPTGALRTPPDGAGISTWFDYDNDGRRDAVVAHAKRIFAARYTVRMYRNKTRGGHWLEVDLTGARGNAEAIGARVGVRAGGEWIWQWVGQSDDSRESQGHYRLYFGLGGETRFERMVVDWPDGSRSMLAGGGRADRVLEIAEPLSSKAADRKG